MANSSKLFFTTSIGRVTNSLNVDQLDAEFAAPFDDNDPFEIYSDTEENGIYRLPKKLSENKESPKSIANTQHQINSTTHPNAYISELENFNEHLTKEIKEHNQFIEKKEERENDKTEEKKEEKGNNDKTEEKKEERENDKDNRLVFSKTRDNMFSKKFNRKQKQVESIPDLNNNTITKAIVTEKGEDLLNLSKNLISKKKKNSNINSNENNEDELFSVKNKLDVFLEESHDKSTDNFSDTQSQINETTDENSKHSETNEMLPTKLTTESLPTTEESNDPYKKILNDAANIENSISQESSNVDRVITEAQDISNKCDAEKQKWENKLIDSTNASMKINLIDTVQEIKSKFQEIKNIKNVISSKTAAAQEIYRLIQVSCEKTKDSRDYKQNNKDVFCLIAKPEVEKLNTIEQLVQSYGLQITSALNSMKIKLNDVNNADRQLNVYLSEQSTNNMNYQKDLSQNIQILNDRMTEKLELLKTVVAAKLDAIKSYDTIDFITGIFENDEINLEKKKLEDEKTRLLAFELTPYETTLQKTFDLTTKISETIKYKTTNSKLQELLQKVEQCKKENMNDHHVLNSTTEELDQLKKKIDKLKNNYLEKLHNNWSKSVVQMIENVKTIKNLIATKKDNVQLQKTKMGELKEEADKLITKYTNDVVTSIPSDLEKEIHIKVNKMNNTIQLELAEISGVMSECENINDDLERKSDYLTFLIKKIKNDNSTTGYVSKFETLLRQISTENVKEYVNTEKTAINNLEDQNTQELKEISIKEKYARTLITIYMILQKASEYIHLYTDETTNYKSNLTTLESIKTKINDHNSKYTNDNTFEITSTSIDSLVSNANENLGTVNEVIQQLKKIEQETKRLKSSLPNITLESADQISNDSQDKLKKTVELINGYENTKASVDMLKNTVNVITMSYIIEYKNFHEKRLENGLLELKGSSQTSINFIEEVESNEMVTDYNIFQTQMRVTQSFTACVNNIKTSFSDIIQIKNALYENTKTADEYLNNLKTISLKELTAVNMNELENTFKDLDHKYTTLLNDKNLQIAKATDLHYMFFSNVAKCETGISKDFKDQANIQETQKRDTIFNSIHQMVNKIKEKLSIKNQSPLFKEGDDFNYEKELNNSEECFKDTSNIINEINELYTQVENLETQITKTNLMETINSLYEKRKKLEKKVNTLRFRVEKINYHRNHIRNMYQQLLKNDLHGAMASLYHYDAAQNHSNSLRHQLVEILKPLHESERFYSERMDDIPNENQEEIVIDTKRRAIKKRAQLIQEQLADAEIKYKEAYATYVHIESNCRYILRIYQRIYAMLNEDRYANIDKEKHLKTYFQYVNQCEYFKKFSENDLEHIKSKISLVQQHLREIKKNADDATLLLQKKKIRNISYFTKTTFEQISTEAKNFNTQTSKLNDTIDQLIKEATEMKTHEPFNTHSAAIFYNKTQSSIEQLKTIKAHVSKLTNIDSIVSTATQKMEEIKTSVTNVIENISTDIGNVKLYVDTSTKAEQNIQHLFGKLIRYKNFLTLASIKAKTENESLRSYRKLYATYVVMNILSDAKKKREATESAISDTQNLMINTEDFIKRHIFDLSDEQNPNVKDFLSKIEGFNEKSNNAEKNIEQILKKCKLHERDFDFEAEITGALEQHAVIKNAYIEYDTTLTEAQEFIKKIYKKQKEKYSEAINNRKEQADIIKSHIETNYNTAKKKFHIISETPPLKLVLGALNPAIDIKHKVVVESTKYENNLREAKKLLDALQQIKKKILPPNYSLEQNLLDVARNNIQDMDSTKQSIDEIKQKIEQEHTTVKADMPKIKIKDETQTIYDRIMAIRENIKNSIALTKNIYDEAKRQNIQKIVENENTLDAYQMITELTQVIKQKQNEADSIKEKLDEAETNEVLKTKKEIDIFMIKLIGDKKSVTLDDIKNIHSSMVNAYNEAVEVYKKIIGLEKHMSSIADIIKEKKQQIAQAYTDNINTITNNIINDVSATSVQVDILKKQIAEQHEEITSDKYSTTENKNASQDAVRATAVQKQKIENIINEISEHYSDVHKAFTLITTNDEETILSREMNNLMNLNKKINELKNESTAILSALTNVAMQQNDTYVKNSVHIIEGIGNNATEVLDTITTSHEHVENAVNGLSQIIQELQTLKEGNDTLLYFETAMQKIKEVQKLKKLINAEEYDHLDNFHNTQFLNYCISFSEMMKVLNEEEKKNTPIENQNIEDSKKTNLINTLRKYKNSIFQETGVFLKTCEELKNIYTKATTYMQQKNESLIKFKELNNTFNDIYENSKKMYQAQQKTNKIQKIFKKIIKIIETYKRNVEDSDADISASENNRLIKNDKTENGLNDLNISSADAITKIVENGTFTKYIEKIKHDKAKLTKLNDNLKNMIKKIKSEKKLMVKTLEKMKKNDNIDSYKKANMYIDSVQNIINNIQKNEEQTGQILSELDTQNGEEHKNENGWKKKETYGNYKLAGEVVIGCVSLGLLACIGAKRYKEEIQDREQISNDTPWEGYLLYDGEHEEHEEIFINSDVILDSYNYDNNNSADFSITDEAKLS